MSRDATREVSRRGEEERGREEGEGSELVMVTRTKL
jgi:hypothetical protein